jgi:hypothetical protein
MVDRRDDRAPDRQVVARHSHTNGNAGTVIGPLWAVGWLFTIGYAQLAWWQGLLALVLWPYFLGVAVRGG